MNHSRTAHYHRREIRNILLFGACLFAASLVSGDARHTQAAAIRVGHHVLLHDASPQTVPIQVTGGELISGIDLYIQVGDGGPELAELGLGLPAGTEAPSVTRVNLTEGTIFTGVADVPADIGSPVLDQVAMRTLALLGATSFVAAEGTLATLQIDTTGFQAGTWPLLLGGVLPFAELNGPFDTVFADETIPLIENGSLTLAAASDFDGNGFVDDDDLLIWQLGFGMREGAFFMEGDADIDGDIDGKDFLQWQARFGKGSGLGEKPLPEPTTCLLALAVLFAQISLLHRWIHRPDVL